jgi:type III secretory pathway component EscT
LYFLIKWIYENWEKVNPNLQSAQIVWGIVIAVFIGLIFWVSGGKEKLKSIINRSDELRDEGMKALAYKWKSFELKEYKEVCKEIDDEKKPRELVEK